MLLKGIAEQGNFGVQQVQTSINQLTDVNGVPDGIRTHVIAVKGRCPGPG